MPASCLLPDLSSLLDGVNVSACFVQGSVEGMVFPSLPCNNYPVLVCCFLCNSLCRNDRLLQGCQDAGLLLGCEGLQEYHTAVSDGGESSVEIYSSHMYVSCNGGYYVRELGCRSLDSIGTPELLLAEGCPAESELLTGQWPRRIFVLCPTEAHHQRDWQLPSLRLRASCPGSATLRVRVTWTLAGLAIVNSKLGSVMM
eukprot:1909463-Rhodomonas_salina.2